MLLITLRPLRTEPIKVILAYFPMLMIESTLEPTQLAKAPFVEGTVFGALFHGVDVAVDTFIPFGTMTLLDEVLTGRDLVFLVNVKILTIISFLALAIEPMNTHSSFSLRFINLLMLRFQNGADLVD